MEPTPVEALAERCGGTWPAIQAARMNALARIEQVREELTKLYDHQTSVVVMGSFARCEATAGSDFDWMLLVDGASDPAHFMLAKEIIDVLEKRKISKPGATETFGKLVSSHDLIH
jgi:predicted nucleotidyltransferase